MHSTAVTALTRIWSDEVNFRSLLYNKSCCLHLFYVIKSNDPDFRGGVLPPTIFDFAKYLVRASTSEHWQFVQGPVPIIIISWPHPRVQVYRAVSGHFQARRSLI